MTQANSNLASHPNMHRPENIRTGRPNISGPVHVDDEGGKERPCLNVDQMRERLSSTNFRPGGGVLSKAHELGRRYHVDSDELLQGAVARSLGQRTRRPDLPVEVFLAQVMRSVGSSMARARARARERKDDFLYSVVAQSAGSRVGLSADELLRLDAEQGYFSALLDELADGDELLAKLIDGIDLGVRGADLAEYLNIDQASLASRRRTLKRRAQAIVRREALPWAHVTATQGGCDA